MCTVHNEGEYSVLSHTVNIKQLTTGTQLTLGLNMSINRYLQAKENMQPLKEDFNMKTTLHSLNLQYG